MLLKDKVIIVSGVGPGMGQSMAKIAAAEGAKVAMGARNQDFLDQVKTEIESAGGEAIALSTDVTKTDQCNALGKAALDKWGRIDGLVNSAYMHGEWLPTDMADPDEFSGVFDVNCAGALRMAQACLPGLEKAGGGAIINVSTMSTVNPFPGEGAYSAGKGGLNALTRHMAKDFGSKNVRVNLCRMGWIGGKPVYDFIDRQVEEGRDRDEVTREITDRIPIGVIPPEEDCAKAVLFFISDYAKVVTGASLDVNGGQYMAP
jgi:NAD(P)-dependent dehydrogenase (short-subunit alcohol dehydrogenase family)